MRAAAADKEDGVKELCTVVFLAMNSWLDIRRREISLLLTVVYAGCGIIYSILQGRKIQDVLIPAGIGILFLAAGLISRGAIGAGDCWHWELCWIRKHISGCSALDFFWQRSGPGFCL